MGLSLARWTRDPRVHLLLCALVLEAVALVWWPTLYLADVTGPSAFGDMLQRRFPLLGSVLATLKSAVDWLFPGALGSWEGVVTFFVHSGLVAFAAYAVAAWSLAHASAREPAQEHTGGVTPTLALPRQGGGEGARAPGLGWVLGLLVPLQLTLLFTPATLTTDVYSYALYGEMPVRYGANPYLRTPGEFPQSALYYLIPLYWHDAPSVYGPLWVTLSAGVAAIFRGQPLIDELLANRAIVSAAHLANTVLVWAVARRLRPAAAPAAALAYGWNPLALLEFAVNGHNDALMLTFALLAVLAASAGRLRWCALALGLSVAAKYTSVLLAPLILVWCARQASSEPSGVSPEQSARPELAEAVKVRRQPGTSPPPWRGRVRVGGLLRRAVQLVDLRGLSLRSLAEASAIVVGTVAVFYLPWIGLPWIDGLAALGPVLYWITGPRLNNFWPEPALTSLTAWTAGGLGTSYEAVWPWVLEGFKALGKVALVGLILWEMGRARSLQHVLAASGRIWLFFILVVNTWVMPWYFLWPLALAAALGWDSRLLRVCAGLSLTALVLMYQRQLGYAVVGEWAGLTLALPLLLALVPAALEWRQRRSWPGRTWAPGGV